MTAFVILAAVMWLAAAAAVAVPLLRARADAAPAPWTALAVLAVLAAGAGALYGVFGNRDWTRPAADAGSPQNMVATLARRLARHPDDPDGWLLLGRSYSVLQEWPLALRAYERADQLAGGRSADALIGQAEALVSESDASTDANAKNDVLAGRAGAVIERALKLAPDSPKALLYGAAAAIERHDLGLARQRFVALLALNPPQNIRPIIQQQIAAIDQQAGSGGTGEPGTPGAAGSAAGEASVGAAGSATAQESARADGPPAGDGTAPAGAGTVPASPGAAPGVVHVHVTLSPALPVGDISGTSLFVFARDPAQPGPPLAVKKLASRFPQVIELSAADAMLPGRALASGQQVEIVARISRSGGPAAQRGDPFGSIAWHVGAAGNADVVIDRLTP